ncbi:MAG: hypothetical protein ACK5N4_03950 [Parabacteroides gordonii]|uniref:hypothetical protein n=1 Tax=Parabacteroides gordonii TaxID=574930 RepID=UPI003A8BF0FF
MNRKYFLINRIQEETANLVRREKETVGDVEPTEGYKGKQIERLKEFATIHNLWIDFNALLCILIKVKKNKVFTGNDNFVVKLNNQNMLVMILLTSFFSNIPYEMITAKTNFVRYLFNRM